MFKKLALVFALAATSSFATWDYFPVLDEAKGSVKGGLYYDWDGDWSQAGLTAGVRYTVVSGLEIAITDWGYQFWGEWDCNGCANGGDGLRDLTLGLRFQMDPTFNVFMDLHLPIGNDDGDGGTAPSTDEIAIYAGAQFSMPIPEAQGLSFGTEAGIDWGFEHNHFERGLELPLGGELDFAIPNTIVTPYLGLKFKLQITENTHEDGDREWGDDDAGDTQVNIWLGSKFTLNPELLIDARLIVRSGDMDGDAAGLYAGVEYFF